MKFDVTYECKMAFPNGFIIRDCARDVLSLLNDHKVPCLVFSAGLGDVLEAILHRDNAYFPNMKVISNFLEFNDEGLCTNIKEPLIHMYAYQTISIKFTCSF